MTRWLAAFAVVLLAAGTARADGFVKLGVTIANRPHVPPPAAGDARVTPAPATAQSVDLRPSELPEQSRLDLVYHPTNTPSETRRQGVSLPYDGDWRVQAAEVGAMVGVFAALVAICGDGKCMW